MKICMISESFLPVTGGLQFLLKYLTEEMAKNSEIFLLSYSDGGSYLEKNSAGFPKFVRLKQKNRMVGLLEILHKIRKISPDIVHVHSAETNAFQIAILKLFKLIRKPLVVTSHGSDIMTYPEVGYGSRLKPFYSKIVRLILKVCDRHVLVGKTMRPFALDSGSREEKMIVINNGLPLAKINVSEEKTRATLEKFGIHESDIVLLSLSGLRPLKGIDILVRSFRVILEELPSAKLLLACSSGGYEQEIRKMVRDMQLEDKIRFIGFVTDEEEKAALVRRCDIFCKPSRLEACSVAILEAMREGKVVVASVPGGEDIIENNVDGLLVPVEDSDAYAAAVISVLKNDELRKQIESNARRNIEKFDISKIALQYINLYRQLMKK